MNVNVAESPSLRAGALKLASLAVSTGFGLGFTQRFALASLEVDPTADLEGVAERLERIMAPHVLTIPGAAAERPTGDPVAVLLAVLAKTAMGLQDAAGIPVAGSARILPNEAAFGTHASALGLSPVYRRLAMPSFVPAAAAEALAWAAWLANEIADGRAHDGLTEAQNLRLDALKQSLNRHAPSGSNMRHMIRAAHVLGIPYMTLPMNVFQFGWGSRARLFRSTETDGTPNISAMLIKNKIAAASVLRMAGLPVPVHEAASSLEAALGVARRIGFPVVVKPVDKDGGKGARAGLATELAVAAAYENAREFSPNVMIEQHVDGDEYRLVVIHGRLFSAHERVPALVTGDGNSTVRQLIEVVNRTRRPGPSTGHALVCIVETDDVTELMAEQGFDCDSVPAAGERVRLQRSPSITGGGTGRQVRDVIHPDNVAIAERVARLLRLDITGIDFLTTDIARPWHETGGRITEVNSQPQISPLTKPEIHREILGQFVSGDGRVPVALVVGGSGGMADAVRDGLAAAGIRAGVACGRGVTIGPEVVAHGKLGLFPAVEAMLTDPAAEMAVLFTDGKEIVRDGLPFDRFDVLVVAGESDAPNAGQVVALTASHLRGEALVSPDAPAIDAVRRFVDARWVRLAAPASDMAAALCALLVPKAGGAGKGRGSGGDIIMG